MKFESRSETLAVVKVHSEILSTYSRYFNTGLSERWKGESSGELEHSLEIQASIGYDFDCFSRMYSLSLKNSDFGLKDFRDVESSLELLKVASQIQFDKLMDSLLLYLSSIFWSEVDEMRLREYSSSPDFPRSHEEDLVGRLGLNESEEDRHKQLYDMLQHFICNTLDPDQYLIGRPLSKTIRCYQDFLTEWLQRSAKPNGTPSNFARTVVMKLTTEARIMLVRLNQDCYKVISNERPGSVFGSFTPRIKVMYYLMMALLAEKLADELVKCFVHLDAILKCLASLSNSYPTELIELVQLIYQEVVAGHVPLRITERIALLANWHSILKIKPAYNPYWDHENMKVLNRWVTEQLFSTLPARDQMEFLIRIFS